MHGESFFFVALRVRLPLANSLSVAVSPPPAACSTEQQSYSAVEIVCNHLYPRTEISHSVRGGRERAGEGEKKR